jgi:hypothetical protein
MQAASHTPHKQTWHPTSEEDHALIRSALEEILTTTPFRSSRRYPAMLRYIVEQTLQGNQDKLKERIIGIEAFGREPAYDTGEDPVVRFSAGEIRKRLAQFYREKGSAGPVELHLPLGTYVPEFYLNVESPDHVLPSIESSQPQFNLEKAIEPFPNPQVEQKRPSPIVLVTTVLALALIAVIWTFARRPHVENQVLNVWSPLLDNPNTVLISTGRPLTSPAEEAERPNLSIKEHFGRPGFRVSITAADAIANIAGFLQQHKKPFRIHDAASNTLADLHGRPVVLVNGNDNRWTLLLLKPTRFNFVSQGALSYIQDSKNPALRDWNVDFSQPFHKQTTDYAIVGRFNSATTGGPVIVVAGISSNGTEAAGEFIVSPERLSELLRSAPPGWKNGNFEAVLKVEVVDGSTGASSIVASEFW